MRHLLLFSLFIFSFSLAHAQSWEPVGDGIECPNSVYEVTYDATITWNTDTIHSTVYSLCAYGQKLYAGGLFKVAGKIQANNIAAWDGKKWDSLGSGTNKRVLSLCVHGNSLNVGGAFEKVGGKYAMGIARWFDTLNTIPFWHYFRRGLYNSISWDMQGNKHIEDIVVKSIIDYKNEIYIGGYFEINENSGGTFCRWNSQTDEWQNTKNVIPDTVTLAGGYMRALTLFNDKVYIIGQVFISGSNSTENMIIWNGTSYQRAPGKFPTGLSNIQCAASSDSDIYFSGTDYGINSSNKCPIVKLSVNNTYSVINGLPHNAIINTMLFYKGKLYVAGHFDKIGGQTVNNIACWDGKSWNALGEGLVKKGGRTTIWTLCIYKGDLYAAGSFNHSGNTTVLNIAKYNLSSSKTKRK